MEIREKKFNVAIECGSDFRLKFTIKDDNDDPLDLTGALVEAQLRQYESAVDYFQFVCTHNNQGGAITITLPKEATSLISYSSGYYDVFVTLASGTRSRVIYGDAKIEANITKPFDGTMLYMIGVVDTASLPEAGQTNRIYFVYDSGDIYRWNGTNYVLTSVGKGVQKMEVTAVSSDSITFKVTYTDGTIYTFVVDLDLDSRYYTKDMVANEFDKDTSYSISEYCIHDGTMYRFISPHSGTWNSSHVVPTTVAGEISRIIQESAFEVRLEDDDFILFWAGAEGTCPYSVQLDGEDYVLYFVYTV